MDSIFEIPGLGIRFGLDPLLGLIPGVGDAVTTLVSLYILGAAGRFGVPRATMARMTLNVVIDLLVGAVPVLGDLFDVAWNSNVRNVELLKTHLVSSPDEARRARRADRWFVFAAGLVVLLVFLGMVSLGYLLIRGLNRLLG